MRTSSPADRRPPPSPEEALDRWLDESGALLRTLRRLRWLSRALAALTICRMMVRGGALGSAGSLVALGLFDIPIARENWLWAMAWTALVLVLEAAEAGLEARLDRLNRVARRMMETLPRMTLHVHSAQDCEAFNDCDAKLRSPR